tara:strand:+ start:77 stop:256 length:180 start_codon:yes stop_codon:yes gene_type:complete
MIITEAKFVLDNNSINNCIIAKINGQPCAIPVDVKNADYAELMGLVDAGELTIEPADTE